MQRDNRHGPSSGSGRRPDSPSWSGSHRQGAGKKLRFHAAVALELDPDSAKEHSGRSSLSANQFRRVLGETVEWRQAAVLRPQTASPAREEVLRALVTGGPPVRGGRMPQRMTCRHSGVQKTCTNWKYFRRVNVFRVASDNRPSTPRCRARPIHNPRSPSVRPTRCGTCS
jgi:hypothetical protein